MLQNFHFTLIFLDGGWAERCFFELPVSGTKLLDSVDELFLFFRQLLFLFLFLYPMLKQKIEFDDVRIIDLVLGDSREHAQTILEGGCRLRRDPMVEWEKKGQYVYAIDGD